MARLALDGEVLETRRGRLLADRPELHLELVADTSWLGASHGTLASGGPVPPAHVHREHADCFLVLEGGLRLLLADGEQAVQGEAWVQVPAGVVHTFAPVGQVRMLNVHAPAAGYSGFIERLAAPPGPRTSTGRGRGSTSTIRPRTAVSTLPRRSRCNSAESAA